MVAMIGSLPFDIIVAGGGPAGIAVDVAAARAGASVLLLERHDCLGGVWTSGLLSYVFDFDKSEIGWEIIRRLDALGGPPQQRLPWSRVAQIAMMDFRHKHPHLCTKPKKLWPKPSV